jgi:hypothetical protein
MHPDRQACAGTDVLFTGILSHDAHACLKQVDEEGLHLPVIVFDLESESGMHMPLRVEQLFPRDHMAQAEAAAAKYRRGQRVTVQASALSVRLACRATHIHTIKNDDEAS